MASEDEQIKMRIHLKGINSTTAKLANGETVTYRYA
jgi:hypothetical protein